MGENVSSQGFLILNRNIVGWLLLDYGFKG